MSGKGSPYAETHDMYTVHMMFRREYALLPGLVRAVAATDEERARVVADHVRLVNLILHHHHSAEDATLWPALLTRTPRETDSVIHLLEGQHNGLDVLLDEVSKRLDGWTLTPPSKKTWHYAPQARLSRLGLHPPMMRWPRWHAPATQRTSPPCPPPLRRPAVSATTAAPSPPCAAIFMPDWRSAWA